MHETMKNEKCIPKDLENILLVSVELEKLMGALVSINLLQEPMFGSNAWSGW